MADTSDLLSKLPSQHVEPLWTVMHSMVPPMPKPRAEPMIWRYKELRPLLQEAGRTVPTEKAERRVLMLVNPSLRMYIPPLHLSWTNTAITQRRRLQPTRCMLGYSLSIPGKLRRHTDTSLLLSVS